MWHVNQIHLESFYVEWWVNINIDANTYPKKITDNQYLDICLTALKILNEEVKEIHFVN